MKEKEIYSLQFGNITKDGHIMFKEDTIKDLNVLSKKVKEYEAQLKSKDEEKGHDIMELKNFYINLLAEAEQKHNKFVEDLIKQVKINGNLSSRIIETEEGYFEHKHDFVLNNIVIERIEELQEEYQSPQEKKTSNDVFEPSQRDKCQQTKPFKVDREDGRQVSLDAIETLKDKNADTLYNLLKEAKNINNEILPLEMNGESKEEIDSFILGLEEIEKKAREYKGCAEEFYKSYLFRSEELNYCEKDNLCPSCQEKLNKILEICARVKY